MPVLLRKWLCDRTPCYPWNDTCCSVGTCRIDRAYTIEFVDVLGSTWHDTWDRWEESEFRIFTWRFFSEFDFWLDRYRCYRVESICMCDMYYSLVVETFKLAVAGTFIKIVLNLRNFKEFRVCAARAVWWLGETFSDVARAKDSAAVLWWDSETANPVLRHPWRKNRVRCLTHILLSKCLVYAFLSTTVVRHSYTLNGT